MIGVFIDPLVDLVRSLFVEISDVILCIECIFYVIDVIHVHLIAKYAAVIPDGVGTGELDLFRFIDPVHQC